MIDVLLQSLVTFLQSHFTLPLPVIFRVAVRVEAHKVYRQGIVRYTQRLEEAHHALVLARHGVVSKALVVLELVVLDEKQHVLIFATVGVDEVHACERATDALEIDPVLADYILVVLLEKSKQFVFLCFALDFVVRVV